MNVLLDLDGALTDPALGISNCIAYIPEAKTSGGFDDGITEELVIGLGSKDNLPVIAALDDVLRLAGDNVAGEAGHCFSSGS